MDDTLNTSPTPEAFQDQKTRLLHEMSVHYKGSEDTVVLLLTALLARGHVLVEGAPGIAKTTLVRTFAGALGGSFKRIQFTPDLLPSDITGSNIFNLSNQNFEFLPGPLFAHFVLGDEINRAPAKTQSALLEAMQEGQITVDGTTHALKEPFMVLATQNPYEHAGTYVLPEAQVDRFLFKINLPYPSYQNEFKMLREHAANKDVKTNAVFDLNQIKAYQNLAANVHVEDELLDYILKLCRFTRDHASVHLGASPRAALGLLNATKAYAFCQQRNYAIPDDVQALLGPALGHRITTTEEYDQDTLTSVDVIRSALKKIHYTSVHSS